MQIDLCDKKKTFNKIFANIYCIVYIKLPFFAWDSTKLVIVSDPLKSSWIKFSKNLLKSFSLVFRGVCVCCVCVPLSSFSIGVLWASCNEFDSGSSYSTLWNLSLKALLSQTVNPSIQSWAFLCGDFVFISTSISLLVVGLLHLLGLILLGHIYLITYFRFSSVGNINFQILPSDPLNFIALFWSSLLLVPHFITFDLYTLYFGQVV